MVLKVVIVTVQGSDQAGRLRLGTTLSSWRQRTAIYKQSDYIMVPSSWASAGRREIRSQSRHLELWVCNNINSLLDIRHHDFYPCDAVHKHSICFRKIFVKNIVSEMTYTVSSGMLNPT